ALSSLLNKQMSAGAPKTFFTNRPDTIKDRIKKSFFPFNRFCQNKIPQQVALVETDVFISCPITVPQKIKRDSCRDVWKILFQCIFSVLYQKLNNTIGQNIFPFFRGFWKRFETGLA